MSLDNITESFKSNFPKAIETKNNGYIISLPFCVGYALSDKVVNDYIDMIHQRKACVEVNPTYVDFKQNLVINLLDICGIIYKMDINNKEIEFKIVNSQAGESFYGEYLSGNITMLKMIGIIDNNEIVHIIKFSAVSVRDKRI
jgi:hypothetical protein